MSAGPALGCCCQLEGHGHGADPAFMALPHLGFNKPCCLTHAEAYTGEGSAKGTGLHHSQAETAHPSAVFLWEPKPTQGGLMLTACTNTEPPGIKLCKAAPPKPQNSWVRTSTALSCRGQPGRRSPQALPEFLLSEPGSFCLLRRPREMSSCWSLGGLIQKRQSQTLHSGRQ